MGLLDKPCEILESVWIITGCTRRTHKRKTPRLSCLWHFPLPLKTRHKLLRRERTLLGVQRLHQAAGAAAAMPLQINVISHFCQRREPVNSDKAAMKRAMSEDYRPAL